MTAAKNAVVKAAFELQNSHVCEKRSNAIYTVALRGVDFLKFAN